jgi:hypothetical protein
MFLEISNQSEIHTTSLERIGIQDDARKYYLHFCHGLSGAKDYPYAIKKPTDNYGKTHQRIINDTFAGNKANSFLARISEGKYVLKDNSEALMLGYLGAQEPIDLLPLVLVHYWNAIDDAIKKGDLWNRFCVTVQGSGQHTANFSPAEPLTGA